eukprot:GHVP01001014.1.p1 GENE.GHVP01001014.1~~GHVP01001014.1.p1  ORF type:complete len:129 (+),score=31.04 GHVP01001014.1:477-863(+)
MDSVNQWENEIKCENFTEDPQAYISLGQKKKSSSGTKHSRSPTKNSSSQNKLLSFLGVSNAYPTALPGKTKKSFWASLDLKQAASFLVFSIAMHFIIKRSLKKTTVPEGTKATEAPTATKELKNETKN